MKYPNGHLLLIRGTDWDKNMSANEIDSVMSRFSAWFDEMQSAGLIKSANPLENTGKVVGASGVTDGPFAEAREAVGGYFWLDVDSTDEAVAFAQKCPILQLGGEVEVRPVAETCPIERSRRQAEELVAA